MISSPSPRPSVLIICARATNGVAARAPRANDGTSARARRARARGTRATAHRRAGAETRGALYFANPASATGRDHLTIKRSDDGGRTWDGGSLLIQEGASAGYSSLLRRTLPGDDANSGILYESEETGCIDFKRFPLEMR